MISIFMFYNMNMLSAQNTVRSGSVLEAIDDEREPISGKLRIKVSQTKFAELEKLDYSQARNRSQEGYVITGEDQFDQALAAVKTYDLTRVFPVVKAFEEKHKKYGLHQWYEITFDDETNVDDALNEFSALSNVLEIKAV